MIRNANTYSKSVTNIPRGLRKPRPPYSQCTHRNYATAVRAGRGSRPGSKIHGFELLRMKEVPELHMTGFQLKHERTGAEYLHVDRNDQNNVFAISFKTNPVDDTGLPHILEHVSLCGSEKYPVRDPFFKMMPRSLSNFMNAFTSSDYTSYPFATTNKTDFKNLSSVYLDATLRPLLKRSDFLQEGWRLGPEDPRTGGKKDDLIFKGVVYNEMKGQMSDASYLFYVRFRDHIFPSLHNSGGDPEKMTDLTYQQLKHFHQRHYHPSNAKFFTYGDLDLSNQLGLVNNYLENFSRHDVDHTPRSPRDLLGGPVHVQVAGPVDTMQGPERQYKSSVSWITCQTSDLVENFSVGLMTSLLLNGYGSPIYQALIESGLGLTYSSNTGYDSSANVGIFTVGLDGLTKEGAAGMEAEIRRSLEKGAEEAFQQHKIDGLLHQLELALKHKSANFGISLLDKTLPGWFNGVDPLESLAWNPIIDAFKQRNTEKGYLMNLLNKYILNDHCLLFTMAPSGSFHTDFDANEISRKAQVFQTVERALGLDSKATIDHLVKEEAFLLKEQEDVKNSNVDCLPTLHVQDIPREGQAKHLEKSKLGNVNLSLRKTSTNGISYFQARQTMANLPEDLRILMPLFTECLLRLGTKTKTVGELEAETLLKTGGISISPFMKPDPFKLDNFSEGFSFTGYSLDQNFPAFLDLLRSLVLDIDFSGDQATAAVRELLESKSSGALDSVAENGHGFATMRAAAALSPYGAAQEQISGLRQIESISHQLSMARTDDFYLQSLVEKLRHLQQLAISNSSQLSVRLACESSSATDNQTCISKFLERLPPSSSNLPLVNGSQPLSAQYDRRSFYDLPFKVSYSGNCFRTVTYEDPSSAPLAILSQLLTHHYLHPEIREKGGAYGASANLSSLTGVFSMSSYRDPHPHNSLATIEKAGSFARDRKWTDRELEEAKLSIFQQIDAPVDISNEGMKEFMYDITPAMEQKRRELLLGVTTKDVQQVADIFLASSRPEARSTCVLGEKKPWVDETTDAFRVKTMQIAEA